MAPTNEVEGDWLASLARQCASSERIPKPKKGSGNVGNADSVNNNNNNLSVLTKAQRIDRRGQKRSQREERKRLAEEARQQRLARKRQKSKHGSDSSATVKNAQSSGGAAAPRLAQQGAVKCGLKTSSTKQAISRLSASLESTVSSHVQKYNASLLPSIHPKKDKKKQLVLATSSPAKKITIINGLPVEPSGKATKRSTLRPDSKELQPRVRDYNGQGLVRPSLYLPFHDPSFLPKLELEFEEHVPGFFGKAKKKAAKKDEDMMLWRKCLKAKVGDGMKKGML